MRFSLNNQWADPSSPFFLADSQVTASAQISRPNRPDRVDRLKKRPSRPARPVAVDAAPVSTVGGAVLEECVAKTVHGLGFEVVDVERSGRGLVRIYIDRVPGHRYPETQGEGEFVTVDDCEVVTRQMQAVLEVEGVPYERLEVSSPGLDRPLKRPADYERFAGQAVDLTLKAAFQGRKHWRGVLRAKGPAWSLELADEREGSELEFRLEEVREARLVPVVDFKGRGRLPRAAG